ncbi:MAG: hypothetical protein IH626_22580 [Rhodospirillales bacterium]|nr:hypothetical protein [Rhodospirillales bacterium]
MSRTDHTPADAMAQWLATGGALDAAAHQESGRDDGLQAALPTMRGLCHADDGLTASLPSMHGLCHADEGLSAYGISTRMVCADDGLVATSFTTPGSPTCFRGDDGLQAGGYSTSFCPVIAPTPTPAP